MIYLFRAYLEVASVNRYVYIYLFIYSICPSKTIDISWHRYRYRYHSTAVSGASRLKHGYRAPCSIVASYRGWARELIGKIILVLNNHQVANHVIPPKSNI